MPLTAKGTEILGNMRKTYGSEAENVFYASKNKGTIAGVDAAVDKDDLREHESEDDKRFAAIEGHLGKLEQAASMLVELAKDGRKMRERVDSMAGRRK